MIGLEINNNILDNCDIILSYFNVVKGTIFLDLNFFISELMVILKIKVFFIYYYNKFISFNYCFVIEDSTIRGREHDLMLSLVCNIDDRNGDFFNYISEIEEHIKKLSLMVNDISDFEGLFEIKSGNSYGV